VATNYAGVLWSKESNLQLLLSFVHLKINIISCFSSIRYHFMFQFNSFSENHEQKQFPSEVVGDSGETVDRFRNTSSQCLQIYSICIVC